MDINIKDRIHRAAEMLFATAGRRFVWLNLYDLVSWTALWWTTKWPFKKVISKRIFRDNIDPLLAEVSLLTIRDVDRAEMFNAFFTSVYNTTDGPRDPSDLKSL